MCGNRSRFLDLELLKLLEDKCYHLNFCYSFSLAFQLQDLFDALTYYSNPMRFLTFIRNPSFLLSNEQIQIKDRF